MFLRCLLWVLFSLPTAVFADDFVKGKDYEMLVETNLAAASSKKQVIEFFSYGCPWCYRLETPLTQWVHDNPTISFSRVPVVFNKDWTYYAKAYYLAATLNKESTLTPILFKAIQETKQPLTSDEAMIQFFSEQGVNRDLAQSAFLHSTQIDLQMDTGNADMQAYHINAVPAFIINGHCKTDLQMAGSIDRLLKMMTYLTSTC